MTLLIVDLFCFWFIESPPACKEKKVEPQSKTYWRSENFLYHLGECSGEQGLGQHVGYDEILVFGEDGPIQNKLRFSDECARHKMLDVIGDLALTGVDIHGKFTAFKSGHRLNAMMARALIERLDTTTHSYSDSENRWFNKSA